VDVPPPATTWAQYRQQLQGLVHGEVPDTWQAATTAAAIELLTGRPPAEAPAPPAAAAEAGKDAAWARAVSVAGATPADAHGNNEAAARHAVLSQLRLQLLLWEQQLVAASGEARYLSQEGSDVVWGSEGAEEESEGEAADNAADDDGMYVDEPQQQLVAAAGKGSKGKAADAKAARGLKRAGSSNVEAAADAAHEAPANKRRKTGAAAAESPEVAAAAAGSGGHKDAAAAAGLPPRPTARGKARGSSGGGAAAAAAAAAEAPSREGSAAPANSGVPAAAAGGSRQKRGRGAPAAAAAAASEGDAGASRDEGDDEAATGGRVKKAARVKAPAAAAGRGRGKAAAADSGELEGSEDAGVSEEVVKGRRLAHLKVLHEQVRSRATAGGGVLGGFALQGWCFSLPCA
jgi:hypothetical protein